MSDHVRGVHHGALGTLDPHGLSDLQARDMLGDVASGVRLDKQVEVALVFVGGDRSIRADDFFGLAFDGRAEGDVLADGEAEDVSFARELEAVATSISFGMSFGVNALHRGIVRENSLLLELKLLELGGLQHLSRSCTGLAVPLPL